MENKQVLTVLTEVLEEQKEATRLLVGFGTTLNALLAKLEDIERVVVKGENVSVQIQNEEIQNQLIKNLQEMKMMISNMPQTVRHERRLLLFPEHNAREYYSVVLKWLFFIIVATYSYWLAKFLIERFTT